MPLGHAHIHSTFNNTIVTITDQTGAVVCWGSAGAAAAWSNHDFNRGQRASTVSMAVQYVGACKGADLICHARALRRGRELTFTEITATDPEGAIVAHALQTYRIV